jgi:hypothetical protein
MKLPHYLRFFPREPKSFKGIKEHSAYLRSAEIGLGDVGPPITREEAMAALERSRARRAANGVGH